MTILAVLFWLALTALLYVSFGYPLLLSVLAGLVRPADRPREAATWPAVTLAIAAYNEETAIRDKLENSLRLDYPGEKLEIVVFSDASTDETEEIVRTYANRGIRLLRIEGRRGKTFCQNETVKICTGEIVVFSDANSMYEPTALKALIRHFADRRVGCVSGELRYRDGAGGVKGERAYWHYELVLKRLEGLTSSPVGANGAIYAIRKDLYQPLRPDVISDFAAPLLIVRRGYRVVHEREAIAWEDTAPSPEAERKRRVRIVARTVHSFLRQPGMISLLNPFRHGFFAVQIWSHRVLRWWSGMFMLLLLALNIILCKEGFLYRALLGAQAVFYALALWGFLAGLRRARQVPKLPHLAYYFCLSCWAMLLGFARGVLGAAPAAWVPSRRE